MVNRFKLKSIDLKGFKSIDSEGQQIEFGDVTVLLGANGAGKSNLVSFFKMLNYLTTEALQTYIGEQGFADSLLFYGAQTTPRVQAEICFEKEKDDRDTYHFTLSHASGDILIFTEEFWTWKNRNDANPVKVDLGAGHPESRLRGDAKKGNETSKVIWQLLRGCQVFQFHDTSGTAKIRNQGYINDNSLLRSNAGNLAAFLFAMANHPEWEKYYRRIVRHIQEAIPRFGDFVLNPSPINKEYIKLDWKEKDSEYRFGPHQLSDGSLRFIAITTLLLQPPQMAPAVIVLDEPELGLHPAAISAFAGMVRSVSHSCQVILATQSTRLVDEFEASEIVVVERERQKKSSIYYRLDNEKLEGWLTRYSLSETWEKNVFGGRP